MATSTSSSSALRNPSQILAEASNTYAERNAIYGDNFRNFPSVMMSLFPEGLNIRTYEEWMRLQFLMLDIVKTTRYAQNFYNGGHTDSIHDKVVYAAMLESTDEEAAAYRKPSTHPDREP